jgi:hypothetical protein
MKQQIRTEAPNLESNCKLQRLHELFSLMRRTVEDTTDQSQYSGLAEVQKDLGYSPRLSANLLRTPFICRFACSNYNPAGAGAWLVAWTDKEWET